MGMRISRQFLVSVMMVILLAPFTVIAHTEAHVKKSSTAPAIVETDFGKTGDARRVGRTILVMLDDTMRFTPGELVIKQGGTIRFVVRNRGKVMHEMVLGREEELKAHALLMQKHPDMEHDEPYMTHVAPGKEQAMVWQFTRPGDFLYGCLVPGHFEAGMVGRIKVLAR